MLNSKSLFIGDEHWYLFRADKTFYCNMVYGETIAISYYVNEQRNFFVILSIHFNCCIVRHLYIWIYCITCFNLWFIYIVFPMKNWKQQRSWSRRKTIYCMRCASFTIPVLLSHDTLKKWDFIPIDTSSHLIHCPLLNVISMIFIHC